MCNCSKCKAGLSCNCGSNTLADLTDDQVLAISKDEAKKQVTSIDIMDLGVKAASGNTSALTDVIANTGRKIAERICMEGTIDRLKQNAGYVAAGGFGLIGIGYVIAKLTSKKGKK